MVTPEKKRGSEDREALLRQIEALEEELARYRRGTPAMEAVTDLLHTFPSPILLQDAEGRILRVNDGFAELLGFDSTTALRGKRLDELLEEEHQALLCQGNEDALQQNRRITYEMKWPSLKGGPPRFFSVVKIPLGSEEKGSRLLLVLLQEITTWWRGVNEEENYLKWWTAVADFVKRLLSNETEMAVVETAAEWFECELGYECVALYLSGEDGKQLVRRFAQDDCRGLALNLKPLFTLDEENWLVNAFQTAQPFYRRLPDGVPHPLGPISGGARLAIALPLPRGRETMGLLILGTAQHAGLDTVAVEAVEILAAQLAQALDMVRVRAELRRSLQIGELLATVTRQVERARSYEELLQGIVPMLDYLGGDGVALRLLERRERDVYLVDIHTLLRSGDAMKYTVTRGLPVPRRELEASIANRDYLFYPDIEDPEIEVPDEIRYQMEKRHFRASITFPLRVRGRLMGLFVFYSYEPMLSGEPERFLSSLRDIVTYSVDRLRLFHQMEETIRQRELLYSALAELSAASSYQDLIEALRKHTFLGEADRNISINLFDTPWDEEKPEWSIVLARWSRLPEGSTQARYPLHLYPDADRVLSAEMPTIIENIKTDRRLSTITRRLYIDRFQGGSTVFFPLVASGRWIGYVNAIFGEPRHFPMEEVRTVMTLINQAAVIVQSLVRMEEMERRAQRLMAAAEVSRAATAITDLERLLFEAVELIRQRFDLYYAGIFLVDENRRWAILRAGTGEAGRKMLEAGHRLEVGGRSMIGACVATGEARIALDVGREAVRFNNPYLPKTRSEMALPLRSGGEIIGAMTIQSTEVAAFTEEDIVVLQTMADQLANAIQVSRLLRSTERSLEQLKAAYGEYTLEAWRRLIERSGAIGYRYRGLDVEAVRDKGPLAEQAWREGRPIHGRDEKTGLFAVAIPIKLRDQVIGVMMMRSREESISPTAVDTVMAIGDRLALALETTRLLEETRRSVMREQLASEIGARIRGELEIESVVETALRELGRVLDVRRGEAYLRPIAEIQVHSRRAPDAQAGAMEGEGS